MKIRAGYVQLRPKFGKVKENIEKVKALLEPHEIHLVVLPELFTTGYAFLSREELEKYAEPIPGPTVEELCEFARRKNMYIAGGIAERDGDRIYNSSFLLGPNGYMGKYRKIHLFYEEKEIFDPGDLGFPVFETPDFKAGLLICFDWLFPEAARTIALKGAHIILHSANLVLPFCQDAMITRSIENRIFIITANRVGEEKRGDKEYAFTGMSQIVAPGGRLVLRDSPRREGAGFAKINLKEAEDKHITPENHIFEDRRREFYEL